MKFSYRILLLLILFIIPLDCVFASSNISVKCPDDGEIGSVVECELFAVSDIEISAIRTKLNVSNNLEFISFKTDSSWQGDGNNGDIALYTYPNKIGEIKLGVVKLKIKESGTSRTGTLYFEEVYFYKADFSGVSGTSISKNIKILSSDNFLNDLSLTNYNITPKFDKDITEYQATVNSNTVVIEASPRDKFATVSGIGKKELKFGKNTFTITVISESGTKREYRLDINRPNSTKNENYPSSITDNGQSQEVNKDNDNKNQQFKDNDSKLRSLVIVGYDIDFKSDIYRYYIDDVSQSDKIDIEAVSSSDKAKIRIDGNEDLGFGINEITITVEAEDGSRSIYTIYVTKKSSVCVVKAINVLNYDLKFECNKYNYELKIGAEDSLNIDVVPINDKSDIHIYNNDKLKNGDVVNIVIKENGVNYKYNIKVVKNNLGLYNILDSKRVIFLIFVIIFVLLYFVGKLLIKKGYIKKLNK